MALLAVVWLNLALAPCAMAMGAQMGDHMGDHMSAQMSASMSHDEAPCSHCPPKQSHCDTELSGACALQAQVSGDSALTSLSLDHHSPDLAPLPVVVAFLAPPALQSQARPPDRRVPETGLALHKRFCVYLK